MISVPLHIWGCMPHPETMGSMLISLFFYSVIVYYKFRLMILSSILFCTHL